MTKIFASLLLTVLLVGTAIGQTIDGSAYCFQCSQRRNHKDMYPDPNGDCHSFYKCLYINETFATGTKMACPVGTYWHDDILQCMPEGSTPCTDGCQDPAVASAGCYGVPGNCASYFVCATSTSYSFCCPPETSFNAATCQCDANPACTDTCVRAAAPPTTEAAPVNYGTYCIDSFNNRLEPTADPTQFQLIVVDAVYILSCAAGTTFSLDTCRCEGEVVPQTQPQSRLCDVYLPFDTDANDISNNKFFTDVFGSANIANGISANGAGSMLFQGGRVEIAGLKTLDYVNKASICYFYRCNAWPCTGGLVSKAEDAAQTSFTIVGSVESDTSARFQAMYNDLSTNIGSFTVDNSQNTASNFTQFCVTVDGGAATFYIDNVARMNWAAKPLHISNCPAAIGTDQRWGDFNGYIDEVLICRVALTPDEVNAHWQGQQAMRQAGLIP